MYQHLSGSLGGSIWVGWEKQTLLLQIIGFIWNLSIYLVGGDVDKLFDSALLSTLEENVSTVDIRVRETIRVSETQIDVRLSSKVENRVDIISFHTIDNLDWIGDITMVKAEISLAIESSGVVQGCAVIELIK
jgi:hypothetical protein